MVACRRPTTNSATLGTLGALCAVLAVLAVGAYGVYADVERGEAREVAAPSITVKPAELTRHGWARLGFTDIEPGVSFQCSLDRSRLRACTSPKLYGGPLAVGRHAFRVRAVRSLGEVELSSITSYAWSIDDRPRAPRIVRHPTNPTRSTSATFSFTDRERHVGLQCRFDSAAWKPCRRRITYRRVPVGEHHLLVRALDPPALPSRPARFQWRVTPANHSVTFSIAAGSPAGLLYPGAAPLPIPVTLRNPNRVPIYVTSLVGVATGGPAGCDSATNIKLARSNASSARPVEIPAGGSVTLPAQGVSAPTIELVNLPVNQDACRNATFAVRFTRSARS
jgi:hypothetical protein